MRRNEHETKRTWRATDPEILIALPISLALGALGTWWWGQILGWW